MISSFSILVPVYIQILTNHDTTTRNLRDDRILTTQVQVFVSRHDVSKPRIVKLVSERYTKYVARLQCSVKRYIPL